MTELVICPDLFFQVYSNAYSMFAIPKRITFPYKVQVWNNFVCALIFSTKL